MAGKQSASFDSRYTIRCLYCQYDNVYFVLGPSFNQFVTELNKPRRTAAHSSLFWSSKIYTSLQHVTELNNKDTQLVEHENLFLLQEPKDGTLPTIEMQWEALESANTNTNILQKLGEATKALKSTHHHMYVFSQLEWLVAAAKFFVIEMLTKFMTWQMTLSCSCLLSAPSTYAKDPFYYTTAAPVYSTGPPVYYSAPATYATQAPVYVADPPAYYLAPAS